MKKFEFKKAYEEVEVAGNIYKVDMSDDKIFEYQKAFQTFYEQSERLKETDLEALSSEQQYNLHQKQLESMKGFTDIVLGEGQFEHLYELAGRSKMNYIELMLFINSIFEEKTNTVRENARKKYVKKK